MRYRHIEPPEPNGPLLLGEQVAELWIWIWCGVAERRNALATMQNEAARAALRWELDEAERLEEAFDRAIHARHANDWMWDRFVRDQDPFSTAKLAHYLAVRHSQWVRIQETSASPDEAQVQAPARLRVIESATTIFHRLLGASPAETRALIEHYEPRLRYSSVFRNESLAGVVVETPEEGPVPFSEYRRRQELARAANAAAWEARKHRPRRKRRYQGGTA